jgi:hypothetical protein
VRPLWSRHTSSGWPPRDAGRGRRVGEAGRGGVNIERATAIMWEAHTQGRALLITCPLELAELSRDRLATFSLTSIIEKV